MTAETTGIDGDLPSGKIVIVASRYNQAICDSLVEGSRNTLAAAGFDTTAVSVVRVPAPGSCPWSFARF